jgi:hypothetical protein
LPEKVCRNNGSLPNRSVKFFRPTNFGAEMPFQLVSDAPIETRIGKNWKATTPTTIGLMNNQPTRFCLRRARRTSAIGAARPRAIVIVAIDINPSRRSPPVA